MLPKKKGYNPECARGLCLPRPPVKVQCTGQLPFHHKALVLLDPQRLCLFPPEALCKQQSKARNPTYVPHPGGNFFLSGHALQRLISTARCGKRGKVREYPQACLVALAAATASKLLLFPLPKGLLSHGCILINGCLSHFPGGNCIADMATRLRVEAKSGTDCSLPSPCCQ